MQNADQHRLFELISAHVTRDAVAGIAADLVSTASPTGEEGVLARKIVQRCRSLGLDAIEQSIDDRQSNAFAVLRGSGGGPSLMLYAPIDTVTTGDPDEDLPWAGNALPEHMRPQATITRDHVVGLGAQNPKGHGAAAMMAVAAIAASGVKLPGDLILGLGAGGMPTDARTGMRPDSGHGVGCAHLLREGPRPDYAVIAKSGWAVSHEEVGFAWYEVTVHGTHTYVGSRHLLPYANAIRDAGKVIGDLEDWFPLWATENTSGLVAPQGVVSFIEAGWKRMPAFTPAVCRFRFDLRLSPRTTAESADAAVERQMELIRKRHSVNADWKRVMYIPGTITDPEKSRHSRLHGCLGASRRTQTSSSRRHVRGDGCQHIAGIWHSDRADWPPEGCIARHRLSEGHEHGLDR